MANASIFDLTGQARPKKKKVAKKAKKKSKKKKAGKWGTPEERYRRLCLLAQLYRYCYYVKSTSIVSDCIYDKLERVIFKIEDANRDIIYHEYSPTGRPGSTIEADYPRSVQHTWNFTLRDRDDYDCVEAVLEEAMTSTCEVFGIKV